MSDSELPKVKKPFQSITYFFFLAFMGLSSLILLIEGSISVYTAFRNEQVNISAKQRRIAEEAGKTVQDYIDEKFTLLDVIATTTNLTKKATNEQENILKAMLQTDDTFTQISLYSLNKQILASATHSSTQLMNQLDERIDKDLFLHVYRGEFHASNTYTDPVTKQPFIILAIPLRDSSGKITNALLAEVNIKNMWDVISKIPVGENGTLYVVDKEGNLLAYKDISRVLKGENLKYVHEVDEYMTHVDSSEEDDSVIVDGINGTQVVTTYFKLRKEPPWAIIVEEPVLDVYRPVIQEIIVLLLIILVTFILAIILSIILSRKITKPLIMLSIAAKKLSTGDLSAKIDVTRNDEIGELAESFREMTKKVQESHAELEEKVNNKTAELESKVSEADRMNRLMVGRELKMIEHKEEITKLKAEIEKLKQKN